MYNHGHTPMNITHEELPEMRTFKLERDSGEKQQLGQAFIAKALHVSSSYGLNVIESPMQSGKIPQSHFLKKPFI